MTTLALRPTSSDVRVWYADAPAIAGDPAWRAAWLDRLAPSERARCLRFRADRDRDMFLVGRAMARVLVGEALGCNPFAWTWREGPRGRPEIADPASPLRFNLAHSADLVVCALAPGRDIGVDVEGRERRRIDVALVERYCAPDEADDIWAAGAEWADRFLVYWTLKESYLKARGLGLALPLRALGFRLNGDSAAIVFGGSLAGTDARWSFRLIHPTPQHLGAVAVSIADGVRPAIAVEPLPAGWLAPDRAVPSRAPGS